MDVTIQKDNSMESIGGVIEVRSDDNELIIESEDTRRVDGDIMNVRGSKIVFVQDYYGSEVSNITGDEIYAMTDSVVSLCCSEAMQVGNRVSIGFKSDKSVEMNGQIIGCRTSEQ